MVTLLNKELQQGSDGGKEEDNKTRHDKLSGARCQNIARHAAAAVLHPKERRKKQIDTHLFTLSFVRWVVYALAEAEYVCVCAYLHARVCMTACLRAPALVAR